MGRDMKNYGIHLKERHITSQQQDIPTSSEPIIGSEKRETFINLRNDLWLFTVPKKTVGTLSCYNNTEKIDPSYRSKLLLQTVGKKHHTFNHSEQEYHEPESTKPSRNKSAIHNPKYKQ